MQVVVVVQMVCSVLGFLIGEGDAATPCRRCQLPPRPPLLRHPAGTGRRS